MKFSCVLLTALFATTNAFAPAKSAFRTTSLNLEPSQDPVDKTLNGIDDGAEHDVFDPLSGAQPALIRNNNDEVWVPQVRFFRCTFWKKVES